MGAKKIIFFLLIAPIVLLALLNLILVFTPELGFDALWYHLTLPKLWLLKHQWYFPGGLLYYSAMPRLSEIIFVPLIHFTGTVGPKFVQYLAGIGTGIMIWKILGDQKISSKWRLAGVSLFYCTWLVSWQSASAYVDLIRTFFEVVALYFLLRGEWKRGGVLLGLAIGTKWLSLGSLAIYGLVFGPSLIFPALIVALPWFAIAYHFTGNPVYPIFSDVLSNTFIGWGSALKHILLSPYFLTVPFDDFISPIIGGIFILALLSITSRNSVLRKMAMIGSLGCIFSLIIDPPSSRFALPYLPAIIMAAVIYGSTLQTKFRQLLLGLVIISGVFILVLRTIASLKYTPYLSGRLGREEFLFSLSYRLPGTFIDTDGYVAGLPQGSKILVDKLHNLYYFPRDFDHTSWIEDRSGYDYLVTIGEDPINVKGELVHINDAGIQVFKLK